MSSSVSIQRVARSQRERRALVAFTCFAIAGRISALQRRRSSVSAQAHQEGSSTCAEAPSERDWISVAVHDAVDRVGHPSSDGGYRGGPLRGCRANFHADSGGPFRALHALRERAPQAVPLPRS